MNRGSASQEMPKDVSSLLSLPLPSNSLSPPPAAQPKAKAIQWARFSCLIFLLVRKFACLLRTLA